jgi:hypothetical protein
MEGIWMDFEALNHRLSLPVSDLSDADAMKLYQAIMIANNYQCGFRLARHEAIILSDRYLAVKKIARALDVARSSASVVVSMQVGVVWI